MVKQKKKFVKKVEWEGGCFLSRLNFFLWLIVIAIIISGIWVEQHTFMKVILTIDIVFISIVVYLRLDIFQLGKRKVTYEEV